MQPGRELDALVAEKVMGWRKISHPYPYSDLTWINSEGATARPGGIPQYSTDIAAAWVVVEHLKNSLNGNEWTGEFNLFFNGCEYECWWSFSRKTEEGLYETSKEAGVAETAPHAICLAALGAVGVNIPQDATKTTEGR